MLTDRDVSIVRLVGLLHQLSSSHVTELVFARKTRTPVDRALSRLVRDRYLARVGRRASDHDKGGAGAYVYQLGPRGWILLQREGRYWPYRAVNPHMLKVADLYVELVRTERAGNLKLLSCQLEHPIGQAQADMLLELVVPALGQKFSYCIEVEITEKRPRLIRSKLDAYLNAYTNAPEDSYFPYVVFVVPDDWLKSNIAREVAKLRPEDQELFRLYRFDEVVAGLMNP